MRWKQKIKSPSAFKKASSTPGSDINVLKTTIQHEQQQKQQALNNIQTERADVKAVEANVAQDRYQTRADGALAGRDKGTLNGEYRLHRDLVREMHEASNAGDGAYARGRFRNGRAYTELNQLNYDRK